MDRANNYSILSAIRTKSKRNLMNRLGLRSLIHFLLVAVLGLAYANSAAAQTAPNLGSTSSFGVVASTFTNTNAATVINGNVCFTTGPATAYTLNGTQTVPCSAQAGQDQNSALATLNGQSCTSIGAGVVTLDTVVVGPNPAGTIPPGCYSSGGAMNVSNLATVTLSGSGVYIFRPNGPLGIGTSSTIRLTNGATAANVYWAPSQATTLGASAAFVGTDIDAAGISLGHLASISGRALAYGGTITADANSITVPGNTAASTVPSLSGWAMIALVALFGGIGCVIIGRRFAIEY